MKKYIATDMGVVSLTGMFDVDSCVVKRPSFIVKFAFMLGSSKQGNARRASVGCIWETAMYLVVAFSL